MSKKNSRGYFPRQRRNIYPVQCSYKKSFILEENEGNRVDTCIEMY